MPTHENIRIEFAVDGRRYEAVGFLKENEPLTTGDTMFQRTAEVNGGAIGEEDWEFLWERRTQSWSKKLWEYYLITARYNPDRSRHISLFYRSNNRWDVRCELHNNNWHYPFLVLRRCA